MPYSCKPIVSIMAQYRNALVSLPFFLMGFAWILITASSAQYANVEDLSSPSRQFNLLDVNADGKLSKQEFLLLFAAYDLDSNGLISRQEDPRGQLSFLDENGDGVITQDEFMVLFKKSDKNNNGYIDRNEFKQ
eukprot:jgi/Botrbrau1/5237/Bobra.0172s0099.1